MSDDSKAPSGTWRYSTRVISKTFEVEGVPFCWWAVGEDPAHVTVSNPIFGGDSAFTRQHEEALARRLAESVLRRHFAKGKVAIDWDALADLPGPDSVTEET